MGITAVAGVVNDLVASLAIVVGGIWAYFKFIKGRTFAYRAELAISASPQRNNGNLYLSVVVTLKNTGLSKLPLNEDMKVVRLFRMTMDSDLAIHAVGWERLLTVRVLDSHDWLEAQEVVTDTLLLYLGGREKASEQAAYSVEALVGARIRRFKKEGTKWTSRSVAFLSLAGPTGQRNVGA